MNPNVCKACGGPILEPEDLLGRMAKLHSEALILSGDIQAAGQFVAAHAFDDVLFGLSKTQSVWNHTIK